eukprot:1474953-Alexandrium_andersonii.AAC.1
MTAWRCCCRARRGSEPSEAAGGFPLLWAVWHRSTSSFIHSCFGVRGGAQHSFTAGEFPSDLLANSFGAIIVGLGR